MSGTTPTPIMEVLLSDNASSDSFYASKAYDKALIGARTATSEDADGRGGAQRRGRRAEGPAVPAARAPERRRAPPHRHLARLAALAVAVRPAAVGGGAADPGAQARAPPPATASAAPAATTTSTDEGWLTTPRSVLIGSVLISLAILGTSFISSGRRRTEPLEWTEE